MIFADEFPKELPGFPPEGKLEFTIDVKPKNKPIARTPYWMSTLELKELKMKLNELLDLGIMSKCVTLGVPIIFI
jgi:hypothetical protein